MAGISTFLIGNTSSKGPNDDDDDDDDDED